MRIASEIAGALGPRCQIATRNQQTQFRSNWYSGERVQQGFMIKLLHNEGRRDITKAQFLCKMHISDCYTLCRFQKSYAVLVCAQVCKWVLFYTWTRKVRKRALILIVYSIKPTQYLLQYAIDFLWNRTAAIFTPLLNESNHICCLMRNLTTVKHLI